MKKVRTEARSEGNSKSLAEKQILYLLFFFFSALFSLSNRKPFVKQDLLVSIVNHRGPPVEYKFYVKALALVHCLGPQCLGQLPTHSGCSKHICWMNE